LRGALVVWSAGGREDALGPAVGGAAAASPSGLDGCGGGRGLPSPQSDAAVPVSSSPGPDDSGGKSGGDPDVP
jgi:hypothetical protein